MHTSHVYWKILTTDSSHHCVANTRILALFRSIRSLEALEEQYIRRHPRSCFLHDRPYCDHGAGPQDVARKPLHDFNFNDGPR